MEGWEVYPTTIHDEFALVTVDLDLKTQAPIEGLEHVLWLRVSWEATGESPLPEGEQASVLEEIEAWFAEELEREGGTTAARLTFKGRREFFAYVPTDLADSILSSAELRFPEQEFEAKVQPDADWQVYLEFLYPDIIQHQRIQNQRVVKMLDEQGDALMMPRPVEHTAVFHSEEARDEFGAFLVDNGFDVRIIEHEEAAERPFGVVGTIPHAVELRTVDGVVMALTKRIQELGGRYDGWGCSILKVN